MCALNLLLLNTARAVCYGLLRHYKQFILASESVYQESASASTIASSRFKKLRMPYSPLCKLISASQLAARKRGRSCGAACAYMMREFAGSPSSLGHDHFIRHVAELVPQLCVVQVHPRTVRGRLGCGGIGACFLLR